MNELTMVFDQQANVLLVWIDNKVRNLQLNTVGYFRDHCCSGKAKMHSMCVVELHVTVKCIKILTVAQQCIYDKFMSLATMKTTQVFI
jgi:hypothetical protein